MSIRNKTRAIISVWGTSFGIMKDYPIIFFPLGVVAFLQSVVLAFLFLAPRPPISIVLAPPIRRFWGEIYLHYPVNFLLLPKLFNYCEIILGVIVGAMMIGMTASMVAQANKGIRPSLSSNFKKPIKKYLMLVTVWLIPPVIFWAVWKRNRIKKYLTLVTLWLILFALMTIVFKGPKFLIMKYYSHNVGFFTQLNVLRIALLGSVLIGIIIETIFAYAIPSVIIENKRALKAIRRSFSVVRGMFLPTFILVLVPTLLSFVVMLLKWKIPKLMESFFPEVTLYILGLGIIVSLFANCLLITSVTTLFLKQVKRES